MRPIESMKDYHRRRECFAWDRPQHFNFGFDVVDRWAEEQPDSDALFWVGGGKERRVTFAELRARSNQVAGALAASGLQRGDRMLVLLPRVVEWWETVVGAFKADVVAMPATTLLTQEDIAYRINASGAAAMVTDAEGAKKVEQIAERMPSLTCKIVVADEIPGGWLGYEQAVQESSADIERMITRGDDPALIYFTSGTTGPPKMVLHSHASYGIGHRVTADYWLGLSANDIHWNVSDTGWAKAAWASLFGPWLNGACVFVDYAPGKFSPRQVLRFLEKYPITTFCSAPTVYRLLVQEDLGDFHPRCLRDCMGAGEPLNPEVIAIWKRATGLTIRDGYGQTETVLLCSNLPGLPIKPGAMGMPPPGIDLAVINQQGERVPTGEEGDLAIRVEPERPIGLFQGYYQNEQATAAAFRDGWYITGDRARVDEDGYFWFVGRADDVITSSAYRIGPFDIEHALIEHPSVVESAAVGKPDPTRGEIVKAFVVLVAGCEPTDALKRELQEHVKRTTAPYKYPREIEFVDALPKTISGKIRRIELRKRESIGARTSN